jgi:hypothetical protein
MFNLSEKNYLGLVNQSEKAMARHSSTLAWEIPWTEEPAGLVQGAAESQKGLSSYAELRQELQ